MWTTANARLTRKFMSLNVYVRKTEGQLSECLSWETEKTQIRENKGNNKSKSKNQ